MSKENLQNKTCKELRELAKDMNISGRWDMTKDQLIDAILGAEVLKKNDESESAKEKRNESVSIKDGYIEKVNLGCLVAFETNTGKVSSAKIIKRSLKRRMLLLETEYKSVYKVSFNDVLWVKTGNRWPKGIYELLKGKAKLNEK